MLNTLRNRLFASYLAVLFIASPLVAFVPIGFLQAQEVPPEFTWQRLELLLTGFTSPRLGRDLLAAGLGNSQLSSVLDNFAEDNAVRVLVVAEFGQRPIVLYDSAREFSARE